MRATFTKGWRKDTVDLCALDDKMFREQFSKRLVVGLLICIMAIQNTQVGMNQVDLCRDHKGLPGDWSFS